MDTIARSNAINKVSQLMKGGDLSLLLREIKQDIALSILSTDTNDYESREDSYRLAKAIDLLEIKLQECINSTNQIMEID